MWHQCFKPPLIKLPVLDIKIAGGNFARKNFVIFICQITYAKQPFVIQSLN